MSIEVCYERANGSASTGLSALCAASLECWKAVRRVEVDRAFSVGSKEAETYAMVGLFFDPRRGSKRKCCAHEPGPCL
jgi:hypothetical protein